MTIIHAPTEVRLMRKRLIDLLLSRRAWIGLALVLGGLEAWGTRHWLNPDGLSYLEIAANAARLGPHELINGLWSPGYPAIIAVAYWITNPGPTNDIPLVHAVNFLLYALALWSFTALLREWMAQSGPEEATQQHRSRRYLVPIGYTCFIALICATGAGPKAVTPDSAVAATMFFAAYCWLRLRVAARPLRWGFLLGFALAAAYSLKAAMFPLSIALLIGCWYISSPPPSKRRSVLAAVLTFFVFSSPLVYLVSKRVGRPTFSDAGRLNYAWHVADVPPPWSSDLAHLPTSLTHAPRHLLKSPLTIAFGESVAGTYPLWYDPSYWYQGLAISPSAKRQAQVFVRGLSDVGRALFDQLLLFSGILALWIGGRNPSKGPDPLGPTGLLLEGWALVACGLYALVHVEARYLTPFLLLAIVAGYSSLIRRNTERSVLVVAAMLAIVCVAPYAREVRLREHEPGHPPYLAEAAALREQGLRPGDRIAVTGYAFDSYYAHVAETPIAAQIIDVKRFSELTDEEIANVVDSLRGLSIHAIVARNLPTRLKHAGWRYVELPDASPMGIYLIPDVAGIESE